MRIVDVLQSQSDLLLQQQQFIRGLLFVLVGSVVFLISIFMCWIIQTIALRNALKANGEVIENLYQTLNEYLPEGEKI
jgi:cellulose synthase/poly-beta-1,6-N-acetylglucosamine synthase-like glycosyltransferase